MSFLNRIVNGFAGIAGQANIFCHTFHSEFTERPVRMTQPRTPWQQLRLPGKTVNSVPTGFGVSIDYDDE